MLSVISIIIVNYNQESYLRKAIESVLEQTKRDWDLLIWDDGSTDNSVAIAREYEQQDDRIRVIAAQHQGVAKARKQAIAETKGNYFGYIDSDDWIANTALEETARVFDSNPEVGMVYTDYYDVNSRGKVLGKGKRCYIPYSPQRLLVDFMTFHFRLIRREVYRQIEEINFNCEYADDYDLCLRLSEVTKFKRIQEPLYYYRHHRHNISYSKRQKQIECSQIAVNRALQRRGLANSYVLKVEGDRFCLRKKETKVFAPLLLQIWGEQSSKSSPLPNPLLIGEGTNSLPLQGRFRGVERFRGRDSSSNLLQTAATLITILPFTTAIGFAGSFCGIAVSPASAQNIIPNNDGTMTIVTEDGNSFNIDGGTLSGDGKNLFHSFQEFGLDAGQIANFLSNPNIQNILGRINGGNPSIINGLIQVTGGNSNLFLMNPSGIIFGNNASLNVSGDFTATTATGIGFGDGWFNAVGTNDYLNLVGNPDSFNFSESGVIINSGDLQVANDSNISLTGSTVINTGTIETEGGNITVAAVPGTNRVRISQEGQLLSLEVPIPQNANGEALPIRVVDLPNLLRGLPVDIDTGLEVAANNDVTVANSDTVIPNEPGTTIVSGTIDASNTGGMGGEVHILGDKVGLIGANIDASGDIGGGEVLVGGDYKGEGAVPNADVTLVDRDSTIKADAWQNGDGGKVIVWSDNTTRVYGEISAKGGLNFGNGGFVETSSAGFLDVTISPNISAANGVGGTWLIDPHNIRITDLDEVDENIGTESPFIATGDDVNLWVGFIEQALQNGSNVLISTGETGEQVGDITLEADLDFNGTENSTLTLEAANDIVIGEGFGYGYGGGILDSNLDSPDALNLFLNADSDESGLGRVEINETIATGGGDININGRSNNNNTGVLVNSNINSGGGDITITGTSTGDDGGLFGVSINNSQITADDGAIFITGVNNDVEVRIDNSSLTTTNNITLTGDEIALIGTTTLNGDNVTLQPATPEVNIAIASGETFSPTLDIAQTELDTIEANSLTIGDSTNGTGTITIDNAVTFDESITLATPLGTIQVDGAITGTDNASITIIGSGTATILNADITTQGQPILIEDNVFLGTDINLNTTDEGFVGANITIDGNLFMVPTDLGPGLSPTSNLNLIAGTGDINITGAIGDTNPIGFINVNSSSTTTFGSTINANGLSTDFDGTTILNGNVTTTDNQFYGDAVELGQDVELVGSGYGGITFNSTVRSLDTPRSLTITTTGDEFSDEGITFNGAVGDNNQPLLSLETNSDTGITSINGGSVITTENQTYNTDISIENFNTDTQLIADSDNNGSGDFVSQNITGDIQENITIQATSITTGNINTGDGSISLLADETVTLNGDITTESQPIEINGNVILETSFVGEEIDNNININTTAGEEVDGADITIDGTINNSNDPDSFTNDLTLTAGTGDINITGAIGDTNPIGFIDANSSNTTNFGSSVTADSLSTDADGITILNGNVTTTDNQFYGDAVELGQDVELVGSGYGGITFESTVRSQNTPRSLTITTTGDEFSDEGITFNGAVGDNNQPLLSLETNSNTGITNINGGSIITTENQTYNTDISINNFDTDTQLLADSDNNGNGAFSAQDIDGDGQNLSIQAASITTGNIDNNFGGDEGGTGNINLSSPGNITTGYIDGGEIIVDSNGESDNTQGLFTSTATLPETDISITGTTVTIEHGGGNTNPGTPFIVGNATNNGTVGDIISATETVAAEATFPNTFISDNETIQIITPDTPIELPIVAAEDGTGSIVTAQDDGVTFNINGGLTSDDQQNLFHSFTRFDLPESIQTANFVANESLDNILARVSSGDASDIQGTIQVTGGNPNLFLINPAGIIFGSTAQLNVPAAFTATTGNGLGFGDDWFSASGAFTPLNGTPNAIALNSTNPGAIITNANLTNNNGALNLVGGTVVTSGNVTANGFSAIAFNEGASIVNLSDFSITSTEGVTNLPNAFTGDILVFADLIELIGEDITVSAINADDIALEIQNPLNSNGQSINLIGNSNNAPGVLIDSNVNSNGGNITITGTSVASEGVLIRGEVTTLNTVDTDGEDIELLQASTESLSLTTLAAEEDIASAKIKITGTSTNSLGVNIQDSNITATDGSIAITGTSINSEGIVIDNTSISTNDNLILTGDEIDLANATILNADNVTLQPETPELDIAIAPEAQSNSTLDLTQAELDTIAANSLTIGNTTNGTGTITVANPVTFDEPITLATPLGTIQVNGAITGTENASVTLNSSQTNLNSDMITAGNAININSDVTLQNNVALNTISNQEAGAEINIQGSVNGTNNLTLDAGSGDINIQGNIGKTSPLGDLQASSTGTTNFGGGINAASITTNPGGITRLGGNVNTTGNQTFNNDLETSENIELNASNGDISTQNITTAGTNLDITANEISTQNITTQGGSVDLQSTTGAIATGDINSSGTTGGEINLDSATTITTQDINSRGIEGEGGDVTLNSGDNEDIRVGSIRADGNDNNGGEIQVNVDNDNPGLFFADSSFSVNGVPTSIFTNSSSSEAITIQHGGSIQSPFEVANPNLPEQDNPNGTVGAIIEGNNQISDESFLFTERRGNITIISDDAPDNNILGNFETESSSTPVESFETAANSSLPPQIAIPSIPEAQKILRQIEQQAAQKPALVYISFTSPEIKAGTSNPEESFFRAESCLTAEYQKRLELVGTPVEPIICLAAQPSDRLEILVVTPEGNPIYVPLEVTRAEVEEQAEKLYREVAEQQELWQEPAELLYQWLISNIEEQLKAREIDNLLFVLPPKLRSLPIAALYDFNTDRFLVEKGYNIGLAPSINLMNTTYNKSVQTASVLALGASNFEADQNQQVLNAVEVELPQIINLRGGKAPILNEQFTLENLQTSLENNIFPIVHLSTHADFNTASIDDIYIQLYNRRLTLNELRSLNLQVGSNDLELLVLSACRSAFGDLEAELGFAGLAVKLGVKTAIGSLWKVSDISTPGLMIEFYNQLKTSPFKAEALRLAQVAMIKEQVQIDLENRQIITSWGEAIELPENVVADLLASNITEIDLSHPYYWAPFTVIGSPW